MRARHALGLALVVALATRGFVAGADEVDPHLVEARRAKIGLRYTDALAALQKAHRWGKNSPAQMAEIYRLTGEIQGGLGNAGAARQAFLRWLVLAPGAVLPPGTSPKIAGPFAEARAAAAPPLRLDHELARGAQPALAVSAVPDPLAMVAGVRVDYLAPGGRWQTAEARGHGRLRVPLPRAASVSLVIVAIDAHGNALIADGSRDQPIVVSTRALVAGAARRPTFIARWPLWTGVAVALGGAAVYFGLDARDAQQQIDAIYADSSTTMYDMVKAKVDRLSKRGRRSALIANVGFGVAGAAAVAALVLGLREWTASPAVVTPAPGGAVVGMRLRF
jgi:hypothetical protein